MQSAVARLTQGEADPDTFDRPRNSLTRVGSLRCRNGGDLGADESERSVDEHCEEAQKATFRSGYHW